MPAQVIHDLTSFGASPATAFPNNHLAHAPAAPQYARRAAGVPPLAALQKAVQQEDWDGHFAEGRTSIHMQADWSATPQRCALLQSLLASSNGQRVLEVGSFCGAAALAMAEALPPSGSVLSLELDEWVAQFGRRHHIRSPSGDKINRIIGDAKLSLAGLAKKAEAGELDPFDFVLIDADKEGMQQYFNLLWATPGLLSEDAVVCVDLTPFKGQPPLRYVKYGFPYEYEKHSGQAHIDALQKAVAASPDFVTHRINGLLMVQRRQRR